MSRRGCFIEKRPPADQQVAARKGTQEDFASSFLAKLTLEKWLSENWGW